MTLIITDPTFQPSKKIGEFFVIDNKSFLINVGSDPEIEKSKLVYRSYESITTPMPEIYSDHEYSETSLSSILLMAIGYASFAKHTNMTITPDSLWSLISDTVCKIVKDNPEKYSHLFIQEKWNGDKVNVDIINDFQSLTDNWDYSIELLGEKIKEFVPLPTIEALTPHFSSSTKMERICKIVGLMDVGSSYYSYSVNTMCGIPRIKLEGSIDDYQLIVDCLVWLKENIEDLIDYVDYITVHLQKIINTLNGDIDYQFWGDCIKNGNENGSGGGAVMTGWLGTFCGYDFECGDAYFKDYSKEWVTQFFTRNISPCLSVVPFKWNDTDLKVVAGIIGSQDIDGFNTPQFGYAVLS